MNNSTQNKSSVTSGDAAWFSRHLKRFYRIRKPTPAELESTPDVVPNDHRYVWRAVVRRRGREFDVRHVWVGAAVPDTEATAKALFGLHAEAEKNDVSFIDGPLVRQRVAFEEALAEGRQ